MAGQDEELIASIAGGDRKAFEKFYNLHSQKVYRIAFGYFNDHHEAEELTQDIFLEIHRSAKKFTFKSAAATWLYRITVNKCLDRLRFLKAKKRALLISFLWDDQNRNLAETLPEEQSAGIADEEILMLFKAMEDLPLQQKTALLLTQIEELSGREAAAVMNTSAKAVESLIQRGKVNLRKQLGKFYDRTKDK